MIRSSRDEKVCLTLHLRLGATATALGRGIRAHRDAATQCHADYFGVRTGSTDGRNPSRAIYARLEPFRIVNGYGFFRVMTKERAEIVIEGSDDGTDWRQPTNSNGNRAT